MPARRLRASPRLSIAGFPVRMWAKAPSLSLFPIAPGPDAYPSRLQRLASKCATWPMSAPLPATRATRRAVPPCVALPPWAFWPTAAMRRAGAPGARWATPTSVPRHGRTFEPTRRLRTRVLSRRCRMHVPRLTRDACPSAAHVNLRRVSTRPRGSSRLVRPPRAVFACLRPSTRREPRRFASYSRFWVTTSSPWTPSACSPWPSAAPSTRALAWRRSRPMAPASMARSCL